MGVPAAIGTAASMVAGDDPATQTERRFDLVRLEPFRYDTPENIAAWTAHLAGLEQQLRLFRAQPGMLTAGRRARRSARPGRGPAPGVCRDNGSVHS
jgi:hypothetical protein